MVANVTFTPDEKARLDHTMSTLTGRCLMKLALAHAMLQRSRKTGTETSLPQKIPWSGSQDVATRLPVIEKERARPPKEDLLRTFL